MVTLSLLFETMAVGGMSVGVVSSTGLNGPTIGGMADRPWLGKLVSETLAVGVKREQ